MKLKHVLIRYDELALKGKNRIFFERQLISNIQLKLQKYKPKIQRLWGRIWLSLLEEEGSSKDILKKIFGISSFSPVILCESKLEAIKDKALPLFLSKMESLKNQKITFRVRTNRVDKRFPLTSQKINSEVANFLLSPLYIQKLGSQSSSISVDLDHPDVELGIEIREDKTFLYTEKEKGFSGLPVGVSGRVMTLLSGGIDSPVAAWQMMKRGCEVQFIHFYSYPYVGEQSKEKVIDLIKCLSQYQNKSTLYLIPFVDIQEEIQKKCQEKFRTLLYRRMMQRIATELARENNILALVTGESLGQVASQTVENLASVSQATDILILRPLVSFHKQETIEVAKNIGTYDISIRPFEDCCTLFQPRNPATKAKVESLKSEEGKLLWDEKVKEAVEKLEVIDFQ